MWPWRAELLSQLTDAVTARGAVTKKWILKSDSSAWERFPKLCSLLTALWRLGLAGANQAEGRTSRNEIETGSIVSRLSPALQHQKITCSNAKCVEFDSHCWGLWLGSRPATVSQKLVCRQLFKCN